MIKKISEAFSFGGQQLVFSHTSETNNCEMNFAVFTPPNFKKAPVFEKYEDCYFHSFKEGFNPGLEKFIEKKYIKAPISQSIRNFIFIINL